MDENTQARYIGGIEDYLHRHNGSVNVDEFIDEVRSDPDHPCYDAFEWDVEKAARAAWRETARSLFRLKVALWVGEPAAPFVPILVKDPLPVARRQGAWVPLVSIIDDTERSRRVMMSELSRVRDLLHRAHEISTAIRFSKIAGAITDLIYQVEASIQSSEATDPDPKPPPPRKRKR